MHVFLEKNSNLITSPKIGRGKSIKELKTFLNQLKCSQTSQKFFGNQTALGATREVSNSGIAQMDKTSPKHYMKSVKEDDFFVPLQRRITFPKKYKIKTKYSRSEITLNAIQPQEYNSNNSSIVADSLPNFKINKSLQYLFRKKNVNLNNLNFKVHITNESPQVQKKDVQKKQFPQRVVDQILADISRIRLNRNLTQSEQKSEMQIFDIKSQKIIYTCRMVIKETRDTVGQVLKVKQDRDQCCNLLSVLLQHCAIFRNHAFQLMVNYHCARINFYYKNTHKCILLLKITKQHAYLNQQFDYIRMKCYQCLGECFMNHRPQICKIYLTKFLQMTWKLSCTEHELKAYEMMGKYYFYVGDGLKAQFYHQRIVDGILENENSPIRKLALSKVQNAFVAHSKEERQKTMITVDNNDGEYVVSSDEESFDFLIANSEITNKQPNNIFFHTRRQIQKYTIRTTTTFDTCKDVKTVLLIHKNANQNIRQKRYDERIVQTNYHQIFQRSNALLGKLKDRVMVSHLSPNRELGNYQTVELLTNCSSQKSPNQLALYNDLHEMVKIKRILLKMLQLVQYMEEQLIQIKKDFHNDYES